MSSSASSSAASRQSPLTPSDTIRFTNCYLALPTGLAPLADLYISPSSGLIISGQTSYFSSLSRPARTIDLGGNILAPGLIDVQINGAYGVDFSELDVQAEDGGEAQYVAGLETVARELVKTGVTSFVPTVITQKEELYSKLLRLLQPRRPRDAASILGYHAEGPFLHPLRRGAHSSTLLLTAAAAPPAQPISVLERVYGPALDQEGVKIITLAPDVEGVMDCVEDLSRRGVVVSIGHSDASLEVATEAMDKGARMITHLFNAMPPIHHRDPGVIGLLGSSSKRPYYGIIADGLHSHPNTVRIAYGACREGCVLVTDAQSPMDPSLPDGVHDWRAGVKFRKEGHKITIDGTNTLAGSCCPLNEITYNLSTFASVPLPEALLCSTLHPAELLGGDVAARKGRLEVGYDADLCVLGWDGRVHATWVGGREAYKSDDWERDVLASWTDSRR